MPRPKVHPENRLRAVEACIPCKASKKKCSGSFPCAFCIQRGRADACHGRANANASWHRITKSSPSSSEFRVGLCRNSGAISSRTSILSQPTSSPSNCSREPEGYDPASRVPPAPQSPEARHKTQPRMLRNPQGERGFTPILSNILLIWNPWLIFPSLYWRFRLLIISSAHSRHCDPIYWTLAVLSQQRE